MIRFDRGDEPPELKAVREEKLPKLRKAIEDGEVLESNDPRLGGYGPPAVREKLYEAQHHKCCYCEKEIEDKYEDLDHFRGRTKVNRGPGSTATHGYWWLAHRWDNLLYACPQCNKAPNKGTKFPLAIGSTALVAEEEPPGRERPLLINPAEESGVSYIEFRRYKINGKDEWRPEQRHPEAYQPGRGETSIKVYGLGRDSLRERYAKHVTKRVIPHTDTVQKALDSGNEIEIRRAVELAKRDLLAQDEPFSALSYDALQRFVPDERLAPWGLYWPVPPFTG